MSTTSRARTGAAALGVVVALSTAVAAQAAANGPTIRVSVATDGSQSPDQESREPAISADGRYVVFSSRGALAANDDEDYQDDVYLRDTVTGATELISVGPDGTAVSGDSELPKVSADGRYVAFTSDADLTADSEWPGGTFLRDRQTGTTTRVGSKGQAFAGPDLTPDGRFVAFTTVQSPAPQDDNISYDVYVWDRTTGKLSFASTAADGSATSGDSGDPVISDDGRYVAYRTRSSELNGGVYGNRVVVTDRVTRRTAVVSELVDGEGGGVGAPAISGDGEWIAYSLHHGAGSTDIRLWRRTTGQASTASVSTKGKTGTGISLAPSLSADGRYVAYWSSARDLVAEPPSAPMSVYRFDRLSAGNALAMTPPDNAFYGSESADISDDGRYVAFESTSAALVEGDTNGRFDVFRTDVGTTPAYLMNTKRPVLTGPFAVGATVRATVGEWNSTPASYGYTWAANGTPIPGAQGSSYRITAKDLGKRLTVTVSAARPGYRPGLAATTSTPVVKGPAPKATKRPKVTGTAKIGRTVKATVGAWTLKPTSYRLQWRIGGKVIPGATKALLKLTSSMRNKKLTMTVTALKAGHASGKATSLPVTVRK